MAFKNLASPEYSYICSIFGMPYKILKSWLHSISYIRNTCAHHSRLWNRTCTIKPRVANAYTADLTPNNRLYAQLVVMQVLLDKISPGNHWAQTIADLLDEHPNIPLHSMGFPVDWRTRTLWGLAP